MPDILNDEQVTKILHGITVPPQPQVIVDIQMEQAMPDPDMAYIAKLICQDVGLAGTILKVVNSHLYGLKNKITSIEQAVNLLGMDSVINISNGLSIKGEMDNETIIALGGFWDSAMDIASVCATVARQIGYQAPDLAYSLGLFHNCGVPLLIKGHANYPDVMKESYKCQDDRIIDTENRYLRTNHAVIGYYTAKSWKLPQDFCDVIAEHHNVKDIYNTTLNKGYDPGKKTLLAILKMSEHICGLHKILGQQATDHEWEVIKESLLEFVGLSVMDFDDIAAEMESKGIGSGTSFYDQSA
ncbi:MAG: HDOD domain-containing protein [Pseudomonadales bacterium]|nr:HDOD domain-containing protein [Pseudomonadales bacterium]